MDWMASSDETAFLWIKLRHLPVQIERHMNPSLAGKAFVVFHGDKCIDASPEALQTCITMDTTRDQIPSDKILVVEAVSWFLGPEKLDPWKVYRASAERGPLALIRKIIKAEGLSIEHPQCFGEGILEECFIQVQMGVENDSGELLQRARALGVLLQKEASHLLNYHLIFGVGSTLEAAREDARVFVADVSAGDGGRPLLLPQPAKSPLLFTEKIELSSVEPTRIEQDEGGFVCPVCRAFFEEAASLEEHISFMHERQRPAPVVRDGRENVKGTTSSIRISRSSSISQAQGNESRSSPPPVVVVRVEGAGHQSFSTALESLTEAQEIESYLQSIDAPRFFHLNPRRRTNSRGF